MKPMYENKHRSNFKHMSEQKGIPKQLLEFKPIINNPDKIEIKQEFEPSEAQLKAKQE